METRMMEQIKHLESQVSQVDNKVSSILFLLKGNEMDKEDRGMIGEQKDHERRITALEKMRDRLIWFLVGLSIPAGWGIIDIIQSVLLKK